MVLFLYSALCRRTAAGLFVLLGTKQSANRVSEFSVSILVTCGPFVCSRWVENTWKFRVLIHVKNEHSMVTSRYVLGEVTVRQKVADPASDPSSNESLSLNATGIGDFARQLLIDLFSSITTTPGTPLLHHPNNNNRFLGFHGIFQQE